MTIKWREIRSHFKKYLHLYKALMRDKRTPKVSKVLLGLAVGYALMPFDLIPDFIPLLGQLDDVIIIPGLIFLALKLMPREVYQRHKDEIFKSLEN